MGAVVGWLRGGSAVRLILFLLAINALPAFLVLMAVPGRTSRYFVWTVHPTANARVLGVMYGNAFLLALAAWFERQWPRQRVAFGVVAPFAVAATIVTFVTLDPFLAHPHVELAYWILMYSILFVLAPAVLVANELSSGGRLPVTAPLGAIGRAIFGATGLALLAGGIGLLFRLQPVTSVWPFALTPLVARILGVWLGSLGVAHVWAAVDGDRLRARPLLLASPLTGILLALVPVLHHGDVREGAGGALAAYLALAGALVAVGLAGSRAPTWSSTGGRRSLRAPLP
jgi:hypothetical protein